MRRAARRAREGEGALRRAETRAPQGPGGPREGGRRFIGGAGPRRRLPRRRVVDARRRPQERPESSQRDARAARAHARAALAGHVVAAGAAPEEAPRGRGRPRRGFGPGVEQVARQARAADRRGLLRRHGDGAHGLPLRQELDPAELEGLPHGRDDRVRLPRPRRQAPARGDPPPLCALPVFLLFDRVRLEWRVDGVRDAPSDSWTSSARVPATTRERERDSTVGRTPELTG